MPERENGKRSIHVETDVNTTTSVTKKKNRWQYDIISDMKILKIKNWASCILDRNMWKLYVEKEEEEEEEEKEEEEKEEEEKREEKDEEKKEEGRRKGGGGAVEGGGIGGEGGGEGGEG
jgi:flagellar biosynthesis/type III secretory pathway protein FliH